MRDRDCTVSRSVDEARRWCAAAGGGGGDDDEPRCSCSPACSGGVGPRSGSRAVDRAGRLGTPSCRAMTVRMSRGIAAAAAAADSCGDSSGGNRGVTAGTAGRALAARRAGDRGSVGVSDSDDASGTVPKVKTGSSDAWWLEDLLAPLLAGAEECERGLVAMLGLSRWVGAVG
jgi:hypothetical protein